MREFAETDLRELFARYPAGWRPGSIERVTEAAGFSGGLVWKARCPAGTAALRLWTSGFPPERIEFLHRLQQQARSAGCEFVPLPIVALDGSTVQAFEHRQWELCTWMDGCPLRPGALSLAALRAGCHAIAQWHLACARWKDGQPIGEPGAFGPSPGLQRRRSEWNRLSPLVEQLCGAGHTADLVARTFNLCKRLAEPMRNWLRIASNPFAHVLCLRDVHREHILFQNDLVTGLIDFGAVGIDTPACDLGRYLGSTAADNLEVWQAGLDAYSEVRPLTVTERQAARVFDLTGTVIGMLHWCEWLVAENRSFPDRAAAVARWTTLVERIEHWPEHPVDQLTSKLSPG